jgi:hypothetical protein
MNIDANILKYIYGDQGSGGVKPLERYASFAFGSIPRQRQLQFGCSVRCIKVNMGPE